MGIVAEFGGKSFEETMTEAIKRAGTLIEGLDDLTTLVALAECQHPDYELQETVGRLDAILHDLKGHLGTVKKVFYGSGDDDDKDGFGDEDQGTTGPTVQWTVETEI